MSDPKTPAQHKAEARTDVLSLIANPATGFATVDDMAIVDAYARACIDEHVAPALEYIERYGQTDGGHHKAWVLDQVVRALLGDRYEAWVVEMKDGGEYDYDEGIAP